MSCVDVHNQAELDAALAVGNCPHCVGDAYFVARGSAHVEARESAHVEARGSAHVEARESAHVEAGGSAHVVARESAHVEAWGSAHVEAGKFVTITIVPGFTGTVEGGVQVRVAKPASAPDWCEYYGVRVVDGIVMLYKAIRDDYRSSHGFLYAPGSVPEAPDWDGGERECGGGLHFAVSPHHARWFDEQATRYMACPVALADIVVHADAQYPTKVKAPRCCAPIYEVDEWGERIDAAGAP